MRKLYSVALVVMGLFAFASSASANNYVLNESNVDQLIASSTEISLTDAVVNGFAGAMDMSSSSTTAVSADKNPWVAAVLAFFLGGWAIHRYYMGTSGGMFFWYFCTCGGIFGVVPLVDFVLILINNENIGEYCNNEKFIMW